MSDSYYDTAQICLNGHVVNASSTRLPQDNKAFCEKCGAATTTACPSCGSGIRGNYYGRRVFVPLSRPSFCPDCGKPYPWTDSALQAAKELAQELEGLTHEERKTLSKDLDDIVADTPRTQVAAVRLKKMLAKAGKVGAQAVRDILVDVASEAAKKIISPTG